MKKLFLFLFGLILLGSCASIKNTFEQEYVRKMDIRPNRQATFSPEGDRLLAVRRSTSGLNVSQRNRASLINTQTGETIWTTNTRDLDEVRNDPVNIQAVWEEGIILFFSKTLTTFRLAAVNVENKEVLWTINSSNPSSFGNSAIYLPGEGAILLYTNEGLKSLNARSGSENWVREDLNQIVAIDQVMSGNQAAEDMNWIYFPETNSFLLSDRRSVKMLDVRTGQYLWEIEENIGSVVHSDVFEDEMVAVFYGPQGTTTADRLMSSVARRGGIQRRVVRALDSGLRDNPLFFVDLNTGKVMWQNEFTTNGQYRVLLAEDKLVVSGLVTYAFDTQNGDILWQTVPKDRIERENTLSVLSEFSRFDFTAARRSTPSDMIVNGNVFVVFPEIFDDIGARNQISLRSYDLESGTLVWKSAPETFTARDFFMDQGYVFVLTNGRFSLNSNLHAYDPYSGEKMYSIEGREPMLSMIMTEQLILHLDRMERLVTYNINTGEEVKLDAPGRNLRLMRDLDDKIFAVYNNNTLAFHDRNSFGMQASLRVPFYTSNQFYNGENYFMQSSGDMFKGVVAMDFDNMEMHGYIATKSQGTFFQGKSKRNTVLDDYHIMVSDDGNHIYQIHKNKLSRYKVRK